MLSQARYENSFKNNLSDKINLIYFSEFEQISINVLDACFEANADDAQLLLLREIPEFGNTCPMEVAVLAEDKVKKNTKEKHFYN